jgi:hypothetical protein
MRPYVEADVRNATTSENSDPIKQFTHVLRLKHGGSEETEQYNVQLIKNLLENEHISRSNVVWKGSTVCKIYGIKMNDDGRVSYTKEGPPPSPEKNKRKAFVTDATKVDFNLFRKIANECF